MRMHTSAFVGSCSKSAQHGCDQGPTVRMGGLAIPLHWVVTNSMCNVLASCRKCPSLQQATALARAHAFSMCCRACKLLAVPYSVLTLC